jgi:hypothetical protein
MAARQQLAFAKSAIRRNQPLLHWLGVWFLDGPVELLDAKRFLVGAARDRRDPSRLAA